MNNSGITAIGSTAFRKHSRGTAYHPLLLILMLVLSLSFGAAQVRAQCGSLSAPSTTWQNGGNSFWNIDGNWTSGTPTASTNACILNGVSTVSLNTTGNANALQLASGNTLNITSVASLTLSFASNTDSSLTNAGKIVNDGTINNYNLTNAFGAHLINYGALNSFLITNTLDAQFKNYGTLNTESFTNTSGAFFINSGSVSGSSGGTPFISNSGTLTNNGTIVVSSETFDGVGVFTNNSGAFLINNGTIGLGPGLLTNNSGALLINNGSLGGNGDISNSGMFINNFKSVIQLNGNVGTGLESSLDNSAGAHFVNLGTINEDTGGINNEGTFNNRGTINLTAQSDPSSFANSGTFNNSGKIGMSWSPFSFNSFSNSATINNSGTMIVTYVPFQLGLNSYSNSGTINNSGMLVISAEDISITGLSPNLAFVNSGTINNAAGTFSTSTFHNTGIINNTLGAYLNNLGTFTNEGIFNNTSGAHLMNAGTFNNTGIFANSAAVTISSTGLFTTSTDYTQTAGHTTVNGTLSATGGAIVDIEGGKLSGTGTINGDVLMKGIMSPGSGGVPGTFTINGNYDQGGTGVFDELISGANSNGLLDVTGILALDPGSLLEITLQGGFNPLGDSFTILDYDSLVGEFSNGSTFFADGFNWTLVYGSNDAVLTAVSAPEPNTTPLIAIGFLALLGFAAKRTAAL